MKLLLSVFVRSQQNILNPGLSRPPPPVNELFDPPGVVSRYPVAVLLGVACDGVVNEEVRGKVNSLWFHCHVPFDLFFEWMGRVGLYTSRERWNRVPPRVCRKTVGIL